MKPNCYLSNGVMHYSTLSLQTKIAQKICSEQWHDLKQINSPHTIHLYAMIPKISLNLPDNAFNILASTIAWKWFSKWWEIPHLPPNYSPIQAIWESSPQVVWNIFFHDYLVSEFFHFLQFFLPLLCMR